MTPPHCGVGKNEQEANFPSYLEKGSLQINEKTLKINVQAEEGKFKKLCLMASPFTANVKDNSASASSSPTHYDPTISEEKFPL